MRFGISATSWIEPKNLRTRLRAVKVCAILLLVSLPDGWPEDPSIWVSEALGTTVSPGLFSCPECRGITCAASRREGRPDPSEIRCRAAAETATALFVHNAVPVVGNHGSRTAATRLRRCAASGMTFGRTSSGQRSLQLDAGAGAFELLLDLLG